MVDELAPCLFRFRLSTMFLLTTLVAGACTILFVVESHLVRGSVILVITILLPAMLTVSVVYGDKRNWPFCIGALFPAALAFFCLTIMVGMWLFRAFPFIRRLNMDPGELAVVVGERCGWLFAAFWAMTIVTGMLSFLLAAVRRGAKTASGCIKPDTQVAHRPGGRV